MSPEISHETAQDVDPRVGIEVVHRRYVPYTHGHYAGSLLDGAYTLGVFGDVATEICIRTDGDEGLFAGYSDVRFLASVHAGDVLEASGRVVRVGRSSRELIFEARVVCRAHPALRDSQSRVLDPPLVVTTAVGTVVVPTELRRQPG
jgi:3-aminobutyryl-CoA ammonia-lyase